MDLERSPAMDLKASAIEGDAALAESALARGADPLARNMQGDTPLLHAVQQGNAECVAAMMRSLRAAGRERHEEVDRAVREAAQLGRAPELRAMLEAGASPEATSPTGFTALMEAARLEDARCVAELLAAGADVDARVDAGFFEGDRAVKFAAQSGSAAALSALMAAGADLAPCPAEPESMARHARRFGQEQCARLVEAELARREASAIEAGLGAEPPPRAAPKRV